MNPKYILYYTFLRKSIIEKFEHFITRYRISFVFRIFPLGSGKVLKLQTSMENVDLVCNEWNQKNDSD